MRGWTLFVAVGVCLPMGVNAQIAAISDGIYDAYDCAVPVSDQRVEIRGNHLAFYESTCEISNPQALPGVGNAALYDASCQGEGATWTTRFILMQTRDGGIAMVDEIWGDHYQRCD